MIEIRDMTDMRDMMMRDMRCGRLDAVMRHDLGVMDIRDVTLV